MKITIELEKEDFDAMHDVILEATNYGAEDINDELIKKYWDDLPEDIQSTAIQWGCNDTVFRDQMYEWICRIK